MRITIASIFVAVVVVIATYFLTACWYLPSWYEPTFVRYDRLSDGCIFGRILSIVHIIILFIIIMGPMGLWLWMERRSIVIPIGNDN